MYTVIRINSVHSFELAIIITFSNKAPSDYLTIILIVNNICMYIFIFSYKTNAIPTLFPFEVIYYRQCLYRCVDLFFFSYEIILSEHNSETTDRVPIMVIVRLSHTF